MDLFFYKLKKKQYFHIVNKFNIVFISSLNKTINIADIAKNGPKGIS